MTACYRAFILIIMENKKLNVTKQNKKLKKELWKKGFFVQEIGQGGEIDYLIVSCVEPKNETFILQDKPN